MNINFLKKGEGETILILHGWGSSLKSWEPIQDDLVNRGYKVVVMDFPGFGESDPPPKPWSNSDYLNWLLEFIKKEGVGIPCAVVGHSFGGGIAMKLAIEHPDLVKKLVLVAAARTGGGRTSLKVNMIKNFAKLGFLASRLPFYELGRKAFYRFIVREKDYIRTKGVMRETMTLVLKEDLTSSLNKIKAPTLIIWGSYDKATPIENAHLINREIKGSKLHIIPEVGHAINLRRPQELAELIHNFIKSV